MISGVKSTFLPQTSSFPFWPKQAISDRKEDAYVSCRFTVENFRVMFKTQVLNFFWVEIISKIYLWITLILAYIYCSKWSEFKSNVLIHEQDFNFNTLECVVISL